MANSYTKLKSGAWGVRVTGNADVGQTVSVTTKAGATKTETIERVLFSGNGVSICAIRERQHAGGGRSSGNVCAECGRGGHLVSDLEDGLMKHYNCCDIPPG